MKISPARLAAFEVLRRIETERSFSSVMLPIYEADLKDADRGLCHELVLGSLRRQIYLDKVIDHYSGSKRLDAAVRIALRLGVYQLLFLDKIPSYSAVNESVTLVQKAKKTSAKGLVNAILRRTSEQVPAFDYPDEIARISVETSHPRWLIEKWIEDFGIQDTETLAIANNSVPRVAFRVTSKGDAAKYAEFETSEVVDGCYLAPDLNDALRTAAARGEIYFQDEASQLVAVTVTSRAVGRFLDVCAAPGGKTTQIVGTAGDAGKLLVSGDFHSSRVRLLRATFDRQGETRVNILQYDAETAMPFADSSFETVLVDAPCSGTGTIRHNPELRYLIRPDDFADLAKKQRMILKNASKLVRFGGRLIYSTCSLQTVENEDVICEFLTTSPDFRQVVPVVQSRFITEQGFVRTFPHRDGVDGFFIAEFERQPR